MFALMNKKMQAFMPLIAFVVVGVAVTNNPNQERNLKVLPQDITDQKLDSIMHSYNVALGVNCEFCHSKKLMFPGGMDFPSDSNPMKENARQMMRMTIQINKTEFNFDVNKKPEYINVVSCRTCHRGQPMPEEFH